MKPIPLATYYRRALTLPLLLPLLELTIRWLLHPETNPSAFSEMVNGSWLGATLAHGAIPYALVVILLLYRMERKSTEEVGILCCFAPLLMFPAQTIYTWFFEGFADSLRFAATALYVGYAYVLLLNLGIVVLYHLRVITITEENS